MSSAVVMAYGHEVPTNGTGSNSNSSEDKKVNSRTSSRRLSISSTLLRRDKGTKTPNSETASIKTTTTTTTTSSPSQNPSPIPQQHHPDQEQKLYLKQHKQDFKDLEQELTRFLSKTGVHKSNVLRLALLPFLRQHRSESQESGFRIKVLQKWWLSILEALRDKSHPVAGSDRSAYLEAVSGIMARKEWTQSNATTRYIYESLLYDTVKLVISKLCLKTVPLSLAAFSGKVLAYAYFWAPGVAPVLLHLLQVSPEAIQRIVQVSFDSCSNNNNNISEQLGNCSKQVRDSFPVHLTRFIGLTKGVGIHKRDADGGVRYLRPKPPPQLADLYGPWARRWIAPNSDVFFAFLKHYYSIISEVLPSDLPCNGHLASPGLILIHASLLGGLDAVVHRPKEKTKQMDVNAVAVTPTMSNKKRVDQLKLLNTIREILHNDDACVQYYESYCRQFESVLQAVALKTRLYEVESCIAMADLAEEYLSSLTLAHSLSKHRVQIQKDNAIDWEFWIRVVAKMLSSDNSHTELRALTLLFNVWDNIPISGGGTADAATASSDRVRQFQKQEETEDLEYYLSCPDGLRWGCTCWLLSINMWKRYFCHWQPLVRTYYHRLLCWRIASVGSESDLLSSILVTNYNSDARELLKRRLVQSYVKISQLVEDSKQRAVPIPSLEASSPVAGRKMGIISNPAISDPERVTLISPQRVNAFDVFDDIAYSYPTSMPPSELFPTDPSSSRNSEETVIRPQVMVQSTSSTSLESLGANLKKKWNRFAGSGGDSSIKRYFSSSSIRDDYGSSTDNIGSADAARSRKSTPQSRKSSPQSSLSSTPPSFTHTPVSGTSSTSTPPSPRSVKSLSLKAATNGSGSSSSSKKAPPKTSLTMHLIPPPPEILRAKPEIARPAFRFGLEFSDRAANRQRELVESSNRMSNFKSGAGNYRNTVLNLNHRPRLPFEVKVGFDFEFEFEFENEDNDDEDSDSDVEPDYDSDMNEFVDAMEDHPDKAYSDADNVKYWKYSGRALSEWKDTVYEFEDFVRSRKVYGVARLEDLSVPFMVAEVPAKVKAG